MRITIKTMLGELYTVDVSGDMEVEDFKAICKIQLAIPGLDSTLIHHGETLNNGTKTLGQYGLKDGDVVSLHIEENLDLDVSSAQVSNYSRNDSSDVDEQYLINEKIHEENIEANMKAALEQNPESFVKVDMLYIDCTVNGYPVRGLVDCGAQATIMSPACAERCNIHRLIDTRWTGIATGVGTQRIIGRIHMAQLQIGEDILLTSFQILENQRIDMLLGLDLLKNYQCQIDLRRNLLVIGSTGTETPFLSVYKMRKERETHSTMIIREQVIRQMVSMGFQREQIIEELDRYTFIGDFLGTTAQSITP